MIDAFWCGGLAGAVGSFATQPLDTIRIKMQTATGPLKDAVATASSRRGAAAAPGFATASCLGAVIRTEGALGLYKGLAAPVTAAAPRSACIFAGYDMVLSFRGGSRIVDHAAAGAAGGILAAPITTPMEIIKCRSQVCGAPTGGSSSILAREYRICFGLWQREGLRGLMCGFPLTAARDTIYRTMYFSTYEATARSLAGARSGSGKKGKRPVHVTLLAGGMAGVLSWLPVYPLDVVKTHWQTGRRFKAVTIFGMLKHGLAAEGPQWLSRGFAPTVLRALPLNAIVCTVYEALQAAARG